MVKHKGTHSSKYDAVSLVFRALESPVRRQLLSAIASKRSAVQELARPLHISLPAVSKHLKILEEASLIQRQKVERSYYFKLNTAPLNAAQEWMHTHTRSKKRGIFDYLRGR